MDWTRSKVRTFRDEIDFAPFEIDFAPFEINFCILYGMIGFCTLRGEIDLKPKCHSLNVVVGLHKESERLSSGNGIFAIIRDHNPADDDDDDVDENDEDDTKMIMMMMMLLR